MSLQSVNWVNVLRQHGLLPKKSLGQNFLLDEQLLAKIVEAAGVTSTSTVLEVGAGIGGLTRHLAQAAQRVVAVELDDRLIPILHEVLGNQENVSILQGNVLDLDPAVIVAENGYLVVANIPYYITSVLIRHLLESSIRPARLVLTIQREVAERICANAGNLSMLALSVQVYGNPYPVLHIPAGAFYPKPKVDSVTLRVDLYPQPRIPTEKLEFFFRLARAGFSQKRKTLRNALTSGLGLPAPKVEWILKNAGIDPQRRAETLHLEEWEKLTESYLQIKKEGAMANGGA